MSPSQRKVDKKAIRVRIGEGDNARWVEGRVLGERKYQTFTELEIDYVAKVPTNKRMGAQRIRMLVDSTSSNLQATPGGFPLPKRSAAHRDGSRSAASSTSKP